MKKPILSQIYEAIAFFIFIVGTLSLVAAIFIPDNRTATVIVGVGCVFSGLLALGIAEVILLIAKIEYNTRTLHQNKSDKEIDHPSHKISSIPISPKAKPQSDYVTKLHAMLDEGTITQEQFDRMKASHENKNGG